MKVTLNVHELRSAVNDDTRTLDLLCQIESRSVAGRVSAARRTLARGLSGLAHAAAPLDQAMQAQPVPHSTQD